jgi:uncharacterized membrane protein
MAVINDVTDAEHAQLVENVRKVAGDEVADQYEDLCKRIKDAGERKDFEALKKLVLESEQLCLRVAKIHKQQ